MTSGGDATAPLLAAVNLKAESTACGNDVKASLLAAADLKEKSMAGDDDATVPLSDAADLKTAKTLITSAAWWACKGMADRPASRQTRRQATKQTSRLVGR